MDNENQKPEANEDEEYQFSPETKSTSSVYKTGISQESSSKIADSAKRKNILIAVGVIIVILCVYKLLDVIFTSKAAHRPSVSTSAPTVSNFPTAQLTSASQQSAEPPAILPVNQHLQTLEKQQANYQASIDKLNGQINDIQGALSNLNGELSTLSQAVQTLATQFVQQQQAQQAAAQVAKEKAVAAHKKAQSAPKPVYYLRSAIPGRAWLTSQNGEIVTVSVGDDLPGYGTVQVIDPLQGTLVTSAGSIIGFAPGDS